MAPLHFLRPVGHLSMTMPRALFPLLPLLGAPAGEKSVDTSGTKKQLTPCPAPDWAFIVLDWAIDWAIDGNRLPNRGIPLRNGLGN